MPWWLVYKVNSNHWTQTFDLAVFCRKFNSSRRINGYLCTSQIEASTSSPRAYPGYWTPFPAREGGHLITTHRGWIIWSPRVRNLIASPIFKLPVVLIPRGLINHGGDHGDKLWWIQRKRLWIRGGLVENQRLTQALLRIIIKSLLIWHKNLATL